MADVDVVLNRVEAAVHQGEIWRAKEILRGNIRNMGFSPRLYERYGRLLLDLGEKYEAGRYLFLSGQRDEEYQEAISVFLDRQRSSSPDSIVLCFPRGARLARVSDYPEPLRSDLRGLGLAEALPASRTRPRERDGEPSTLLQWGCIVAVAAIAILTVIGFVTVLGRLLGS